MRVLAIFALIQIAGILGGPVAPEPDQTQNTEAKGIEVLQGFFNDALHIIPFEENPRYTTALGQIKCRMNGGSNAENLGAENMKIFIDSLILLTNETQLQLEVASDALRGGLGSASKTACQWLLTLHSLLENLKESMKPCWTSKERTTADLVGKVSSALVQYVCQDEGSRVSAYLTADGVDCAISSAREGDHCLTTNFSSNTTIYEPFDTTLSPPWVIPPIVLNTQACREFEMAQRCIVGVLKRCKYPTPAIEANSLFNIVKKESGCENLIKAHPK